MSAVRARLAAVRESPRRRYAVAVAGGAVGILVATLHWTGLVGGGAVVGLAATRFRYALAGGVVYGVVAWVAFAAWLAAAGVLGPAIDTGAVLGISLALSVVPAALGSLARGLV